MKKNRLSFLFLSILLSVSFLFSQNNDSIFVERLLKENSSKHLSSINENIIYIAKKFTGTPYCGGTLDTSDEEILITRTDSLDCTTFVETVLAMYITSKDSKRTYTDFCESLQYIRYRNGIINGYTSRLHYFSDWVNDNSKKGILYEVTNNTDHKTRVFSLNYMTSHYEQYPLLKSNNENVVSLKKIEEKWVDYAMTYIPKDMLLSGKSELNIEDGDIIALTTSIDGLDVVHLGFACWIEDKLHLLHASSLHKKVILDSESLYEYLKDRKKHTGIRVIRVK